VAVEDGMIVGGAGAYLFDTTVPGGARVPTAGVMAVGVLPTHRRRGILRGLMRKEIDDIHEWGQPLATLYASEGAIYRHYGYGPATVSGDIALARGHASFYATPPQVGRARMVTLEEALELFPPVYDRVAATTPAMFTRSRDWWETRRLAMAPWMKGELFKVVLEIDGAPEAYAMYTLDSEMEHGISKSVLNVREAIGATSGGMREIWRFLFDIDWIREIRAYFLPPDHPLFLLLTEPRRMAYRAGEGVWCRLVDVGEALEARSYVSGEAVVLEVADEFCPWNAGRWEVSAEGVQRSQGEPDLALGVDMLGCVYLGGFTFADLARAGRVEELKPGALARADVLFHRDTLPWCPEIF
jgi:predicted acetyltransferase